MSVFRAEISGSRLRIEGRALLGTPTTVQTATFTVQARDQAGNTTRKTFRVADEGGQQATQQFSITISP